MDFNSFIALIKENKCRLYQGRQAYLFDQILLLKNREELNEKSDIIESCCPPQYREKMLHIIKNIPLRKTKQDMISSIYNCSKTIIGKSYIKAIDLIGLIKFISNNKPQKANTIVNMYGLQKECRLELEELIATVIQVSREFENLLIWKQIEERLLTVQIRYSNVLLILALQDQTVNCRQKLKQLAIKYNIFIIQQQQSFLFDTISRLGVENEISRKCLNESTYPAFINDLTLLCQRIIVRQSQNQSLIIIQSSLSNFQYLSSNHDRSIQQSEQFQIMQASRREQNIDFLNQNSGLDGFSTILIDSSQHQESNMYVQLMNPSAINLNSQRQSQYKQNIYKQRKQKQVQFKRLSFNNPFQSIDHQYEPLQAEQKALIIILSDEKVDFFEIYKQRTQKMQIQSIVEHSSFLNVFYTFVYLNLNQSQIYQYQIKLAFRKQLLIKTQFISINQDQSHKNCKLIIIKDSKIKGNFAIVLNFALLNSIGFIINNMIRDVQHIQDQIFVWLRLLYNQYKFIRQSDLQKILKQFRIQDKRSLLNTKFFIYFFYSIYKEKALQYCMQNSQMKLKYLLQQDRQIDPNYPQSIKLYNAYLLLNLYDTFKHISEHQQEQAVNILLMNIKYQQQNRLISILDFVANQTLSILLKIDRNKIIGLFIEKQSLCVHDYFNFRMKYLRWQIGTVLERQQQAIIMELISDLIQILTKTNHQQCRKQIFDLAKLNQIFVSQKGFILTKKHLKVGDNSLPQLYLKCKQLYVLSNHQFDFLEIIIPFLKQKAQTFAKQFSRKVLSCVLAVPQIGMLDKQILNKIDKIGTITNKDMTQIIVVLVQNEYRNYNLNKFQKILKKFFQRKSQSIRNIQPQIVLQQIDRLYECSKGQTAKEQISRFFTFFSSFLSVFDDKENQVSHMKLKECLLIYFRLRNHNFRRIFIFAIFNELRQKIRREREITNLIIESIPQEDEQKIKKRQYLINLYQS